MKERLSIEMGVTIFRLEKRRNWLTLWDGTAEKLVPGGKVRMAIKKRLLIEMGVTIIWMEDIEIISQ